MFDHSGSGVVANADMWLRVERPSFCAIMNFAALCRNLQIFSVYYGIDGRFSLNGRTNP
jgi:hypothetical protein